MDDLNKREWSRQNDCDDDVAKLVTRYGTIRILASLIARESDANVRAALKNAETRMWRTIEHNINDRISAQRS